MFDSHKLTQDGQEKIATLKKLMADAVRAATELMPDGREKALFMTKMEEGVFYGVKAVASGPANHTDVMAF